MSNMFDVEEHAANKAACIAIYEIGKKCNFDFNDGYQHLRDELICLIERILLNRHYIESEKDKKLRIEIVRDVALLY